MPFVLDFFSGYTDYYPPCLRNGKVLFWHYDYTFFKYSDTSTLNLITCYRPSG